MKFTSGVLVLAISAMGAIASAQINIYHNPDARGISNNDAGLIKNVRAEYNTINNTFSWSTTFGAVPGNTGLKTDAFWLVVSPGPNPKGTADELAIMYFDARNPSNAVLTAYAYNGVNGNDSFKSGGNGKPADKIASSLLDSSLLKSSVVKTELNGDRTLSFTIDATKIQGHKPANGSAANWSGVRFGEKVGIWFHPTAGSQISYRNGWLDSYNFSKQGWLDGENFTTKAVPEPFTLAALALAGLAARRKRKSA